ncbi:pre-rRNA processing and 40S ribosomal subunit assembly [Elasticomyces elasticus]|nr:pre-rRNA processing and 40S ribosomal subunit assembly [Elasticomyces elasticus]KAK3659641.1 pre-rRNA processing and 40S ribosomal subunit assembly [Elasticomyces elasticus]KAK4916864.1 pre-rRNA processing and 40S ribosomal subunit assembly [Elasticomyces elasticus]KAK5713056.1 pre-rRNA processing and 40S ribosomal subunit assembly [Elasticomyces elasticus]KAK5759645.1 pre-rRNA processing and 40S ribosomal subunit assembly [Elasticomyces elasticus]
MAVTLGKRKRRDVPAPDDDQDSADEGAARALFQRAFEAKFKPLPESVKIQPQAAPLEAVELDDEDEASDWSGLSDDEAKIEVIKHDVIDAGEQLTKQELKAFMSSKPPATIPSEQKTTKSTAPATTEDDDEAGNLKQDLALQRLLKESHLLDFSSNATSSTAPEGKGRIKALDLRLKDLGAKKSLLEQEKMPIAHRKGIVAKATSRETVRRKDAVANGVILEKARVAAQPQKRRERGVDGPAIGKFKGGTLKLSAYDVKSIERSGPQKGGKGRKR